MGQKMFAIEVRLYFSTVKNGETFYGRHMTLTPAVEKIQSTLVISNSKGLAETLRDIRSSTYQSWENEENNKLNNHI